jgi:hypothetical protein
MLLLKLDMHPYQVVRSLVDLLLLIEEDLQSFRSINHDDQATTTTSATAGRGRGRIRYLQQQQIIRMWMLWFRAMNGFSTIFACCLFGINASPAFSDSAGSIGALTIARPQKICVSVCGNPTSSDFGEKFSLNGEVVSYSVSVLHGF